MTGVDYYLNCGVPIVDYDPHEGTGSLQYCKLPQEHSGQHSPEREEVTSVTVTIESTRRTVQIECFLPDEVTLKLDEVADTPSGHQRRLYAAEQVLWWKPETAVPYQDSAFLELVMYACMDETLYEQGASERVLISVAEQEPEHYCVNCGQAIVQNSLGMWVHRAASQGWCRTTVAEPEGVPAPEFTPVQAGFWEHLNHKHIVEIREAVGASPNMTWGGVVELIRERFQPEEEPHEEESES